MSFSRTAAFTSGVVATLVVGAGTAVASGGASLVLGQGNAANAVTGLVNTKGTPLSLQAKKGSAPLKVNSSVKVNRLNADLLDGRDSSAFLPAAGKAADSALLGGQPPSAYLPAGGTAANAAHADTANNAGHATAAGNADKLGGQDPSAYLTNVWAASTSGGSVLVKATTFDVLTVPAGTYQLLFTADLNNKDSTPASFFCQPASDPSLTFPFADTYAPGPYGSLALSQVVTFAASTTVSMHCYTLSGNESGDATILNSSLTLTQVHLAGGSTVPAMKSSVTTLR